MANCSEHGNGTSFYIKWEALIERLSNALIEALGSVNLVIIVYVASVWNRHSRTKRT